MIPCGTPISPTRVRRVRLRPARRLYGWSSTWDRYSESLHPTVCSFTEATLRTGLSADRAAVVDPRNFAIPASCVPCRCSTFELRALTYTWSMSASNRPRHGLQGRSASLAVCPRSPDAAMASRRCLKWSRSDLNTQPSAREADALPIELRPRSVVCREGLEPPTPDLRGRYSDQLS